MFSKHLISLLLREWIPAHLRFNAESFSDQCRSVHLLWFVPP